MYQPIGCELKSCSLLKTYHPENYITVDVTNQRTLAKLPLLECLCTTPGKYVTVIFSNKLKAALRKHFFLRFSTSKMTICFLSLHNYCESA